MVEEKKKITEAVEEKSAEKVIVAEDATSKDETSKDATDTSEVSVIGDGGGVYQIDVDTDSSANWGKIVVIILSIFILLAAAGGGWYFFMRDDQSGSMLEEKSPVEEKMEEASKEASKTVEASNEAMVEEKLDLADYDIKILNGSGTAGEAGVVEGLLEGAGFEGMDTGNADTYDYTDTEIQLKKKTPKGVYSAIEESLSGDYNVSKGDSLDADADYDVVVIVGQRS